MEVNKQQQSLQAIEAWSRAQDAPKTDLSRPEGFLRLKKDGALEFVAEPKFWDKVKHTLGWRGWSSQRVLSHIADMQVGLDYSQRDAVVHFFAHTFHANFTNEKVRTRCLAELKTLIPARSFLGTLGAEVGIDIPEGLAKLDIHITARYHPPFEAIVAHNGFVPAVLPKNPTREQKLFVEQYNHMRQMMIDQFIQAKGTRISTAFTRELPFNTVSGEIDSVVRSLRSTEAPLMRDRLQSLLNDRTVTGESEVALCINLSEVFRGLTLNEAETLFKELQHNNVSGKTKGLNDQGLRRLLMAYHLHQNPTLKVVEHSHEKISEALNPQK